MRSRVPYFIAFPARGRISSVVGLRLDKNPGDLKATRETDAGVSYRFSL